MARIHVNTDTGNTGVCKASKEACPFGGESGEENHYATREEAVAASEKMMAEKYKEVYKGYRQGETEGMGLPAQMKKRLIQEATEGSVHVTPATIGRVLSKDKDELIRKTVAEKLGSQKLLRDMADDESARVRKAVAMKSNNRQVLEKLTKDPDGSVRHAAMNNLKTPVKARKAAQAALKAANIENLAKARGKAAGEEPIAAEKLTDTSKANATSSLDKSVADAVSNNKDAFHNAESSKKARSEIAKANGVTVGKVQLKGATNQISVEKEDGVHVYNGDGSKVGVVSPAVHERMSRVQDQLTRRRTSARNNGRSFGGLRYGSTVWPAFRNAHDPEVETLKRADGSFTESTKVGISRNGPDGTDHSIQVTATDGNTYTYNSMNLSLTSVEKSNKTS